MTGFLSEEVTSYVRYESKLTYALEEIHARLILASLLYFKKQKHSRQIRSS